MDSEIAVRARESFDGYRSLEQRKFGSANDAKAREINKRLRQLGWTVNRANEECNLSLAQSELIRQMLPLTSVTPEYQKLALEHFDTIDRIEFFMEAFYWIAHRTGAVIRRMPGLKLFAVVGVRNVRNHLIEHREKSGGRPSSGLGWGGPNGPAIASEPYGMDQGLFTNAKEFFGEVERVTRRCIECPDLIA